MKKTSRQARKVAPKAAKGKTAASKGAKHAVAVKAAKGRASKKISKRIERKVADVVTAAARASVNIESAVGHMQRAAVRKVGEVAAKATRAMAKAVAHSPKIPAYDDLPVRAGAPAGAAWGVFGDDDEVGTINPLTAERVIAAAAAISSGED